MEYTAYVCYSVVKIQEPNKSHSIIKRNENENVVGKPTGKKWVGWVGGRGNRRHFILDYILGMLNSENVIWNEPIHDGQAS